MKFFKLCVATLMWAMFFGMSGCSEYYAQPAPHLNADGSNNSVTFRSGVRVYSNPETEVNSTLLQQRDGYATLFTDPYGNLWTMGTAHALTDQDFAEAGTFQASETDSGATFYYGKVRNWEIDSECVAYMSAGNGEFVMIRRFQDQGACPTSAGYAEWLPQAEVAEGEFTTKINPLWAYGVNNSPDNIEHGSFNDVPVYGNDPFGHPCGDFHTLSDCSAYSGITRTGTKWDSAEFVNRYLRVVYDRTTLWTGPAKYLYENKAYGLARTANCGSVRPRVGDVLVSEGGPAGHAAIVRAVSDHSVTVIQQNWFESSMDNNMTLEMRTSGNSYCVADFGDGYPVSGWLRK